MIKRVLFVSLLVISLSGCVTVNREFIEALAADPASNCTMIGGTGAGIGIPILGSGMPLPLGGTSGYLWFGRATQPNAEVKITSEGCEIRHGELGVEVIIVEPKAGVRENAPAIIKN